MDTGVAHQMEKDWSYEWEVNTSGLSCPLPVLKARKALLGLRPGQRLLLIATDPMAAIDVPHFCAEAGHHLVAREQAGDGQLPAEQEDGRKRRGVRLRFLIERGADRA